MKTSTIFSFIVLTIITVSTFSAPADHLVTDLPADFPYDFNTHKIYSGYLNIKETPTKRLHYVLTESQNDPATDPLVLWLNGGPGCSSKQGFLNEVGPVAFIEQTAKLINNPYSWNKKANVFYLDSPAGVGFSIAEREEDYHTNDEISGKDNLSALLDFFEKFPEYKGRDFYVSGESYAGIYIPYIASYVIDHNETASEDTKINLKGLLIGNGVTDWSIDTTPAMIDFAFQHDLYSVQIREQVEKHCKDSLESFECYRVIFQINESMSGINSYDIYRKCYNTPHSFNYAPFLQKNMSFHKHKGMKFLPEEEPVLRGDPPCTDGVGLNTFLNREEVKKALHVEDLSIEYTICGAKFGRTYDQGTKGSYFLYEKLISNKLKILIYSGDSDAVVPFNGTQKWIKNLQLDVIEKNRSWRINNEEVAGYVTVYDGLTFLTVKGTGHMVPQWKRAEAYHMFDSFVFDKDF